MDDVRWRKADARARIDDGMEEQAQQWKKKFCHDEENLELALELEHIKRTN